MFAALVSLVKLLNLVISVKLVELALERKALLDIFSSTFADSHRQLILQPPPASLEEARDVVKLMMSTACHAWITGMAALDVLDAAIDGRDLAESCRLF